MTPAEIAERAARPTEHQEATFALISSIAHELRTPLSALSASAEMLGTSDDPEDCKRFLAIIQRQTRRLTGIIDGMLEAYGAAATPRRASAPPDLRSLLEQARIDMVVKASRVRTRPLRRARDWGYQRLASGSTIVIADMAPPPPSRITKGGCASTLAFELCDGTQRLIVNCGGTSGTGAIPADLAKALRTTAAHSTLTLGDSNSTAIHADGKLGAGVSSVEVDREELEGGSRIDGTHDGYAKRFGLIHKRTLALSESGRELRGEDALLPVPKQRRRQSAAFAIRFHLAPGAQVTPTADGQAAFVRTLRELPGHMWCSPNAACPSSRSSS